MPQKRQLVFLFRCLVVISVIVALGYTVRQSWQQLTETDFRLASVNGWAWLEAIVVYLAAMFLACVFWHRILIALGQQPAFSKTLLAFFASQLGKDVPGKAMVVIVRTDIVSGPQVKTAPAAASVFVETLTWIFVGSVVACILLPFQVATHPALQATAWGLAILAGVLTSPPIFRKIAALILKSKVGETDFLAGLNLRALSVGWLLMGVGWLLNGLSLWLVIRGLPETNVVASDFWLTLTCVSLATVAGFVSLLPGGLGVRELVMIPLLGARFGVPTALIAAVVIRLVWLGAELLSAGIIFIVSRRTR